MLYCSRLVPDGKLFLGQEHALAIYLEFFDGGTDVIQSAVWMYKVISQRISYRRDEARSGLADERNEDLADELLRRA